MKALERRGVSLLEVLVAIAVIGILLALIVPAVQNSRRTARSVQCKDHLRQLGIATHNFQSSRKHWPGRLMSLLPFMEQQIAHDMLLEWDETSIENGFAGPIPAVPNISTFECPEDSRMPSPQRGLVSYFFNDGTSTALHAPRRIANGICSSDPIRPLSPSNVVDGLSTTAMYSERLVWARVNTSPGSSPPSPQRRYTWGLLSDARTPEELSTASSTEVDWTWPPSPKQPHAAAMSVGKSYFFETWYDHALTPNSRPVYSTQNQYSTRPATSQHGGYVHVAYCDGRVAAVSDSIDIRVWRATGTRAGRESISK